MKLKLFTDTWKVHWKFTNLFDYLKTYACVILVAHKCHDVCPKGYRVVCALHNGCLRTFASSCVMRIYNCKYRKGKLGSTQLFNFHYNFPPRLSNYIPKSL